MSEALVNAIKEIVRQTVGEMGLTQVNVATPTPTPTPAVDPFAGLGGATTPAQQQQPVEVTPKMIQELIIPMLSDEAKKARLSAAMQEMGITELPAARPDQLPQLYSKFRAIADETAGAAVGGQSSGVTII